MRPFALLAKFSSLKPGLFSGLTCSLIVWACFSLGWLRGVERLSLDSLFLMRGPRFADPRIVIIAVDDGAVVRAGERTGSGWPLPRRYYARAVQKLSAMGAKTIAFDVLFSEPGPKPGEDFDLSAQCRRAKNVTQACAFQLNDKRSELSLDVEAGALASRFALNGAPLPTARDAIWAAAPLPSYAAGAAAMGHVTVFPEASGMLRRVPHVLRWHNRMFPSLSLAATSQFLGIKPTLDPAHSQIHLGKLVIPLDRDGLTWVNWVGAGGSYPTFGLNQLLDGDVPSDAIKGRLVLVGVTAMGAFENRAVPFSGSIPAVDFQANAMDDILSRRILRAVPRAWSIALMLVFPFVCALLTMRRGAATFWPVPLCMAIVVVLDVFLMSRDLYLPVGATLVGGALAFTVTAAGGYRREWESNARADAAVSSLARGTTLLSAALSASSRDRERLLNIIRATASEILGAREIFLLLDEQSDDPRVQIAARYAQEMGAGWVWPPPASEGFVRFDRLKRRKRHAGRMAGRPVERKSEEYGWLRGQTIVAAPLPQPQLDALTEGSSSKMRPEHKFRGALVAIGRREGGIFGTRDAVLLETLADGAALALANWDYSSLLRGRIESTNRDLENAYQLLAEQSAKLFAAVESIDAAIVVADADGAAAFVNPAGARVLRGATPILGESVASALADGDLEELAVFFECQRFRGIEAENERLETPRGRDILAAQFTPLLGEDGQMLGAMLVVSDVTTQRELDRMKTDFVGFVAHELRTPLTTILGYASLLDMSADRFDSAQIHSMTSVISRHCRRMNRMISDLMDISRLESGMPLSITRAPCDVCGICERLIEEQKHYLNTTPPISLIFDGSQCPLDFVGDSDRIEQVVINLLSNAVKYSPEGGDIILSLRQTADNLIMEFSDQGMGMTAEQLEMLFQKFYRTPDAVARGIKGNGLGLNLVRQIVEAHGGRIEAFSARDVGGRGTTFRLTFPRHLDFKS